MLEGLNTAKSTGREIFYSLIHSSITFKAFDCFKDVKLRAKYQNTQDGNFVVNNFGKQRCHYNGFATQHTSNQKNGSVRFCRDNFILLHGLRKNLQKQKVGKHKNNLKKKTKICITIAMRSKLQAFKRTFEKISKSFQAMFLVRLFGTTSKDTCRGLNGYAMT